MTMQAHQAGWGEQWPAPAKLNLMLRITGRREDGYHLLQTVFMMTDLCDWLIFHPVADSEIKLKSPIPGVKEEDDLTVRAARLLQNHTGCKFGVCIEIVKNLPMGGGLGGGSSDAATVLVALNQLWNVNVPLDELMALGLKLGADVPVFVYGQSAWAEGVGEQLQAVSLKEQWVVILKPACHVNTGEIFSDKHLTRDSKPIKIADFTETENRNDCEAVVCDKYPQVKEAMLALSEYSDARLTGTGACVFALFSDRESAFVAYSALAGSWEAYMAKGCNQSPLYAKIEQG